MKKFISIIGSGPSALMLAAKLDEQKFDVSIYEKNQTPARKFLVAGQGGFNLTHSESFEQLRQRYIPATFFEGILNAFSNTDLRDWLASIGIPTYVGSSKRVFPEKGIKPIEVLNAILAILKAKNVKIITNYNWQGRNNSGIKSDITIFALGGASWKITGSDGSWTTYFEDKGIKIIPFQASNCAVKINWSKDILAQCEGQPLKNCIFSSIGVQKQGEAILTKFGMEGGAIYALCPQIRQQLNEQAKAILFIDLKPTLSLEEIIRQIKCKHGKKTMSAFLEENIKLSKVKLSLLKALTTKLEFNTPEILGAKIKALPIEISGLAPIDEAISTTGGIALSEIDDNFQLKKLPNHYAIGEMLDWDAPTGGYLLQGCFSMGSKLAEHLNL